jgi:hypothetical protein
MNAIKHFLITFVLALAACDAAAQATIGRILVASGEVELVRAGHSAPALMGAALNVGDRIRTGDAGNAQLWFTDSSVVSLRNSSEFQVEQYRFDNRDDSDGLLFNLTKGGLRTLAGLIGLRNNAAYQVRTPIASMGRRGTQYALRYCNDDCSDTEQPKVENGVYGGIFDGRVAVKNNAGETEFSAGEYFYVVNANTAPLLLLGPPSFLADRLRGLGRGVAKAAAGPAAASRQDTASASRQDTTAASGDTSNTASSGTTAATTTTTTTTAASNESGSSSSSASSGSTAPVDSASTPSGSTGTSSGTSTTSTSTSTPSTTTSPTVASPPATTSTSTPATFSTTTTTPSVPVTSYTSTNTTTSNGNPVVVPQGAPPAATLGMTAAWFVTPPINFVEDPWGRTMFGPPATLTTSGTGAAQQLDSFTVYMQDTLNTTAQSFVSETLHGDTNGGMVDMVGYDPAANIHWGRWVSGQLIKTNKPPGAEVPLSGVHYIYGNPTPDTVIAAKTGSFTLNDIGGTTAVDSTGALACNCSTGFGNMYVNFTTRTGSISSVNYTFPTASYGYSNLPFQIYIQAGAGAWIGADISSGGTCTGSGCSTPGTGNAGAVFNGIFFGPTGSYLGVSFHGSSGGHGSGFSVARLFR